MRSLIFLLVALFPCFASAEPEGYFSHHDWEILCDNTGTCRAAGYSPENGETDFISILLTRGAGPGTPVQVDVALPHLDDDQDISTLTLNIGDKSYGELQQNNADWRMTPKQINALLAALRGDEEVSFSSAQKQWLLSTQGASAVLLKMDDEQGRIDTPGALVRKGKRAENTVPPARALPVINAARTPKSDWRTLTHEETEALRPKLLATLREDSDCYSLTDEYTEDMPLQLSVTTLDDNHALVSTQCWLAAYNEGYGYWTTDSALKAEPRLVTTAGTDYDAGIITMSQKARGIGDCWAHAEWVWDGEQFRQSDDSITGMCRMVPGGIWSLKKYVADVKE